MLCSPLSRYPQCLVSLRRIEKYLNGAEIQSVPPLAEQPNEIAFQSCTVTWPQDRSQSSNASSAASSAAPSPRRKFILVDLNLKFPRGELSLICGRLGSGKTLLLLALLGEADVVSGQIICPRSPPDALAVYAEAEIASDDWVVDGLCAYVPQTAWLRNATIKGWQQKFQANASTDEHVENILFSLPFNEERYNMTLEVRTFLTTLFTAADASFNRLVLLLAISKFLRTVMNLRSVNEGLISQVVKRLEVRDPCDPCTPSSKPTA
jgi:energy-coupling factor transporter ATP-binding protein EcfA2